MLLMCSYLKENRRDFKEWAQKVEALEKQGIIEVLRMGWEDSHEQKLENLEDAVIWIHERRKQGTLRRIYVYNKSR